MKEFLIFMFIANISAERGWRASHMSEEDYTGTADGIEQGFDNGWNFVSGQWGTEGNFSGRRRLYNELPSSCVSLDDAACKEFSAERFPDTSTFNADVAFNLVNYYCCALRKVNTKEMLEVANNFRIFCNGGSFSKWLNSHHDDIQEITAVERAIAKYCPNYATLNFFLNTNWANLWNVVRLGLSESAFLKCDKPSEGTSRATVRINGYENDLFPHVSIQLEGEIFSWGSRNPRRDSSNFDSVTGIEGVFYDATEVKMPFDVSTWEITGLDVEKMLEQKQIIKSEPYDLIQNNCAHVALKIIAAGLGCEPIIVPFFTPAAMVNVMNNLISKCNV